MAVRKRTTATTLVERNRYKNVLTQLINAPGNPNPYGKLVSRHTEDWMMHPFMGPIGTQRFLPWHRDYLLKVEKMGQAIDPLFFIPYWDWTSATAVPSWLVTFKPTVKVVGPDITVTRSPHSPPSLPTAAQIAALSSVSTYANFVTQLDPYHGNVHVWCHGTMSNVPTASADPLFWLHHAMIDRIWANWQVTHPNQNPALSGTDPKMGAVMGPWTETATQLKSITALGYSYGP